MGGGVIPHNCVGGGTICTRGDTNRYHCMVVTFHATGCLLVQFIQKGILKEELFGQGVGWVKEMTGVAMAILNLSCL